MTDVSLGKVDRVPKLPSFIPTRGFVLVENEEVEVKLGANIRLHLGGGLRGAAEAWEMWDC